MYAPMLVSSKCCTYFSQNDAEAVCNVMVAKARNDTLEDALGLLVDFIRVRFDGLVP